MNIVYNITPIYYIDNIMVIELDEPKRASMLEALAKPFPKVFYILYVLPPRYWLPIALDYLFKYVLPSITLENKDSIFLKSKRQA